MSKIPEAVCAQLLVTSLRGTYAQTDSRGLTMRLAVVLHQVLGNRVDLHGQLPRGRNDNHSSAIAWHELGSVQKLQ